MTRGSGWLISCSSLGGFAKHGWSGRLRQDTIQQAGRVFRIKLTKRYSMRMRQLTRWTERLLAVVCRCTIALAAGFALVRAASPEKAALTEYEVKAAFLFNFAKFVDWPGSELRRGNAPMVLGVLGEDPFGEVLDRILQAKQINKHPLILKRFQCGADPTGCHVLFISASEKDRLPEIVRAFEGRAVLLVSETDRFLECGGMINFYIESASVKFAINLEAAQRSGLRISSKLLSVAKVVNVQPKS
jgi:hypothetical protein